MICIAYCLCWKEVSHASEWQTCLSGPAHLFFEDMVQGQFAAERVEEVQPVHADHPFAPTKCDEPVLGETAVAHEESSGPCGLLF